jgi:hypothetical protein
MIVFINLNLFKMKTCLIFSKKPELLLSQLFCHVVVVFLIVGFQSCATLKSTDPEKRIKALVKTDNTLAVINIARSDPDERVRTKAVSLLNDQKALSEIALNDTSILVCQQAVSQLTDDNHLAQVALGSKNPEIGEIAVGKIEKENLLKEIVLKSSLTQTQLIALTKMVSQADFYDIAYKSENPEVRKKALERITDEQVLLRYIMEHKEPEHPGLVIEKIKDQEKLSMIVKSDRMLKIRETALLQIDDIPTLKELAISLEEQDLANKAIVQIKDEEVLFDFIMASKEEENFLDKKVERLTQTALDNIVQQSKLSQICTGHKNLLLAKKSLVQVDSACYLKQIAIHAFSKEISLLAVNKIEDQIVLMDLTGSEAQWEVRQSAFNQLDKENLAVVAEQTKDESVRLAANIKLGKQTWSEAFNDLGSSSVNLGMVVGAAALVTDPRPSANDVVSICHKFIRKGDASRIPELRYLLLEYGGVKLAEDYLNCGHPEMYNAAVEWGRKNGYYISSGYGSHRAKWGSNW